MSNSTPVIDIEPFTAAINSRFGRTDTFVIDGWEYATDGHAIICWPTDEADTYNHHPIPVKRLEWQLDGYKGWQEPQSAEPISGYRWCEICDGSGYDEESLAKASAEDDVLPCKCCGGDSKYWLKDRYRRLAGILVPSQHYHGVTQLPGVEVSIKRKNSPVAFRADGDIRGFVMPVPEERAGIGDA